jgi:hypothetical protein
MRDKLIIYGDLKISIEVANAPDFMLYDILAATDDVAERALATYSAPGVDLKTEVQWWRLRCEVELVRRAMGWPI